MAHRAEEPSREKGRGKANPEQCSKVSAHAHLGPDLFHALLRVVSIPFIRRRKRVVENARKIRRPRSSTPPTADLKGPKAPIRSVPIGVTVVASRTVVGIARFPLVVVIHGVLVVVFMAIDATERGEITRRRMAFHTGVPFPVMGPTVDPEVLGIMVECRRIPGGR